MCVTMEILFGWSICSRGHEWLQNEDREKRKRASLGFESKWYTYTFKQEVHSGRSMNELQTIGLLMFVKGGRAGFLKPHSVWLRHRFLCVVSVVLCFVALIMIADLACFKMGVWYKMLRNEFQPLRRSHLTQLCLFLLLKWPMLYAPTKH